MGGFSGPFVGFARQNLLITGGFELWQRGAGPFSATAAYTADRWQISLAGTDTLQVDREAAVKEADSLYSALCTFVLGTGAGATRLRQRLVISDGFHWLLGRTVSLRMSVRTATAAAVRAAITTDGTGGTSTYSGYHTGGGTFEQLTVAGVAIPADATYIELAVAFAASATVYLDNSMAVEGSVAAPYRQMHPADEMDRAQRYYEIIGGEAFSIQYTLYETAGNNAFTTVRYAEKSVTPTVTKNGVWALANCNQPTVAAPSKNSARMYAAATATGSLQFQADNVDRTITVEANP